MSRRDNPTDDTVTVPGAFSVVTFNMHKGFSGDGRSRFELPRMREALARTGADIVFLQEAQGEHRRHARRVPGWPEAAQFEFLADRLWPHHAYGRNAWYPHGHHGNALLSRFPLEAPHNIDVSPWPFPASRSLLHAQVALPPDDRVLHIICVHLGFVGVERGLQLRRLASHFEARVPSTDAVIVAGDFNDWSGGAARGIGTALGLTEVFVTLHGRHARTYPAWAPLLPMDRIYCRGLTAVAARRLHTAPWPALSDHAPLQAWFQP